MMWTPAAPSAQRRRLTRAFLASFFDNDLTASAHDRKETFIWTMGLLASPGFIFPLIFAGASWGIVGMMTGFDVLRDISRDYKIVYLGFAMVGPGVVSALVWNRLLVDRRDALVIGVLPVRPVTVTTAKLLAVLIYVSAVSAVMHVPASIVFGGLLSTGRVSLALLGGSAHFLASFMASLTVFLALTTVQALLALVVGPTRAPRWSVVTQVALVASLAWLILATPSIGEATRAELHGAEARRTSSGIVVTQPEHVDVLTLSPGLERSPPVWFFGVYETLVGTDQPVVRRMAARGALAFAAVTVATMGLFPLACRRLLVSAISDPGAFPRTGRASSLGRWVTSHLTTMSAGRAAIQMLLAAAGRLPRHRLVVAASLGAAIAVALPAVMGPAPQTTWDWAAVRLLGLPFHVSTFLLVGLRFLIRTPGELRAGWILAATDPSPHAIKRALRRAFLAIGVIPCVVVFAPLTWWVWGAALAAAQALFVAATGILMTAVLLFRWSAMPCAEQLTRLDQGRTGRQVLLALLAIVWLASLPAVLPILARSPRGLTILLGLLAVATTAVMVADRYVDPLPRQDQFKSDTAFQLLGLD